MKIGQLTLTTGAIWTVAQFAIGQVFRLSTNVILTRLLAPELFGIMTIVNTLKTGIELISDVGIGQSIIYNKKGDDPDFYDTAWTINVTRGFLLWVLACGVAFPAAHYYHSPELRVIIPTASFVLVLTGFTSISQFLIQKRLQISKLTLYEIILGIIWSSGQIALAYFLRSIWALVLGMIFGAALTTIGSYFLIPGLRHRIMISRLYVSEILHLGKWIFLSSIIYFLSISFDRLYLAGAIPLELLGVYGIARSISDIFSLFVMRLGNLVVFPYIASHSRVPRPELRSQLISIRRRFLFIAALGFSISATTADFAISLMFDARYHAAVWMVPVMILGAWVTTLCCLNESTLLGIGTPRYGAFGYGLKYFFLLGALPLSFNTFGTVGAVAVIAASDVFRYFPIAVGQLRERISFGLQDLSISALMITLVFFLEWLRLFLGFGTSFGTIPS